MEIVDRPLSTGPDKAHSLLINEIFFSIQGESSYVGYPTVFVRTSRCHLRCTYCDTKYAYHEGQWMDLTAIKNDIKGYGAKHVCITGGEPLLQKNIVPFMTDLCDEGYYVSLETSGSLDCKEVDPRVKKVIDVKTPDSGAPGTFCEANLKLAEVNTEFKFVICSEKDFEWAQNFARQNQLFETSSVLFSPSFGCVEEKWLAEKILSTKSPARLQLQLHKYIWSPHTRGV
jgi:7-carboxy-7-deazaguanine synthase